MILFLYYYLSACAALGVTPLPVSAGIITPWALVCNSCDPRQVVASTDLLVYNNARFTRVVASHEACYIFLGHDTEFVKKAPEGLVEWEARNCTREHFWIEWDVEEDLAHAASEWFRGAVSK